MIPQSKAKIFPANERGVSQSGTFKSQYSFNFQNYQQAHKMPFGNLSALNEDILTAQQSLQIVADTNMYLVLVPLTGAVVYHDSLGNENYLAAGHVQAFNVAKNTVFGLLNPYHDEAVNFLQLWIKNETSDSIEITSPVEVRLVESINQMNLIISHAQFNISIGKFKNRKEGIYKVKNERHGIFAFIIDGQMEVQYRLLQPRDGLSIWEQEEIEWGSSNGKCFLLIAEVKV